MLRFSLIEFYRTAVYVRKYGPLSLVLTIIFVSCGFSCSRNESAGKVRSEKYSNDTSTPKGATIRLESSEIAPSSSELASRVREVYEHAREIEFIADITHAGHRIECSVHCWLDGRHSLEVRKSDGTIVYTLDQIPLSRGRLGISERNLETGRKEDYSLTNVEFASGTWDIRCGEGLGFDPCLFGGYLGSWLGPNAHRSVFFRELINNGKVQRIERFGEAKCYVVETHRQQRPGEEVWVDCYTGLVMRWRDQLRDREFVYRSRSLEKDQPQ